LDLQAATIEGDATQVRQVIMNLITNASDALNGQAGEIHLRSGVRNATAADLRSPYFPGDLPDGSYAFVEVEDSGAGMNDETLSKIFDPFFTTKFTGRGLGLAAVLGIVRGHRGTIKVSSTPGRGTLFQVFFPSAVAVTARGIEPAYEAVLPHGQGTVLVVEDEPSLRSFAQMVLESTGFQVRTAADGQQGLEAFVEHRQEIVAVLLDLTMPRMDGLEVLRQLRQLAPNVPVLLMSGYNEHEVSKRCAEIGASGFIQKPFAPNDLVVRVCALLSSRADSDIQRAA
jgi:CheY-like chemotaxis protein